MALFNTCYELAQLSDVRTLAYYSHILPTLIIIVIGILVALYARSRDKAVIFVSFTIILSLWLISDLIAWTSNNYQLVAAAWSPLDYLNVLFYLFIFFFAVFDFTKNHTVRMLALIVGVSSSILPFLITVSGASVIGFDEPNCEMSTNGFLTLYKLGFEWAIIITIAVLGIISVIKHRSQKSEVRRIILTAFSTVSFLAIFSSSEYIATYTEVYEINLYALFTLPVFILLLAISIFEMKTFHLKLESVKVMRVLFAVFVVITVSNLLFSHSPSEFVMSITGVVITIGFGMLVVRGANREADQRKEIEQLALNLERANTRLEALDKQKSEFVSIASHQLRSPLTSIRGYASMLLEGSFGKVPPKAREPIERIEQSSRLMASAVEDYLNVSRIESGNMKYNLSDFNLRNEVEHICDDMRADALHQGLVLLFRTDLKSRGVVNADIGKTIQAVQNLINNAIKYTEKGTIKVLVRDNVLRKRIYVDIEDTGIGMSGETLSTIFQKFERADNANSVNVNGTGLGLYVSQKMIEAMGGTVSAYSEGDGKGSRFTLELPLAM